MLSVALCNVELLCTDCPFKLYGRGHPTTRQCQYGKVRKGRHSIKTLHV